jgi:hypothetical protein
VNGSVIDEEITAIGRVYAAVSTLPPDTRKRVLDYVTKRCEDGSGRRVRQRRGGEAATEAEPETTRELI